MVTLGHFLNNANRAQNDHPKQFVAKDSRLRHLSAETLKIIFCSLTFKNPLLFSRCGRKSVLKNRPVLPRFRMPTNPTTVQLVPCSETKIIFFFRLYAKNFVMPLTDC